MARVGLDAMLLILPENIYYSTGYASNFAYITGEVGRTVAVVPAEGKCGVVCGEFEKLAAESCGDIEVNAYPMWMYIEDYCRGREKMDIVPDLNKTFRIAMEMLNLRPDHPDPVGFFVPGPLTNDVFLCIMRNIHQTTHIVGRRKPCSTQGP